MGLMLSSYSPQSWNKCRITKNKELSSSNNQLYQLLVRKEPGGFLATDPVGVVEPLQFNVATAFQLDSLEGYYLSFIHWRIIFFYSLEG